MKGDYLIVGGCTYDSQTPSGTLIYKIPSYAVKKNNLFLVRHWQIPNIISTKENHSKSWTDFIDVSSHRFLVRAYLNKHEKLKLIKANFQVSTEQSGNDTKFNLHYEFYTQNIPRLRL